MFDQSRTPWVYRPLAEEQSGIAIYIPWRGYSARNELRDILGAGVPVTFDQPTKLWIVSRHWLKTVAYQLSEEFGECIVYTDHKKSEICTGSCQSAEKSGPEECECICGGANHGDGFVDPRWTLVKGDMYKLDHKHTAMSVVRREAVLVGKTA